MIQYGAYAVSWALAGKAMNLLGYGSEYEVCVRICSSIATISSPFGFRQILQSNIFAGILFLLSSIPSLPLSIYHTFVLEEKHGFNKTTPGLFVADLLKGVLLAVALGAPFLSAFIWVFQWAGDRFVPWLMGFLCVLTFLACPTA